jgi:site-specific DNA recombinase
MEKEVWDTVCQLIREPEFLIEELSRHNGDDSQKEVVERELKLCQTRLKAIPDEQKHLVEGYRKGLYADFMMREEMDSIQKEQEELERRKNELERQLAQRFLSEDNKAQIRRLAGDMRMGLDNLDFAGKQELLRLLVEKIIYDGQNLEIQTIIRPHEQLQPNGRELERGGKKEPDMVFCAGKCREGEELIKIYEQKIKSKIAEIWET